MANRRFNKQVPGHGCKHGGQVNKSIVNRLEELGRVDAERGRSRKGIKNLRDEKKALGFEMVSNFNHNEYKEKLMAVLN